MASRKVAWITGGSTGIGLAIAKSLVGLHGGSMKLRSKPGAGTVVLVTLPVSPPAGAAVAA